MKGWQFITLMVTIVGLVLTTFIATYVRIDSLNARLDARFDALNGEIGQMGSHLSDRIDIVNQRIDKLYGLMQRK